MTPQREPLKPGQESVWDYPRPPRLEPSAERIRVELSGEVIADSTKAFRVLETSHPPVYYIPISDISQQFLVPNSHRSFCEWKGVAGYYDLAVGSSLVRQAAWYYPKPSARFAEIANYLAFYPSKMEACYVGEDRVTPQAGDFYGGWITPKIVGPFKGGPGTRGW